MKPFDSRHGGIISALLFAGTVAFLAMLVAGVIVTKTVRVRTSDGSNGTDLAIDTPGGRLNIRTRDRMNPAIVGVPIYPGAYRVKGSGERISNGAPAMAIRTRISTSWAANTAQKTPCRMSWSFIAASFPA